MKLDVLGTGGDIIDEIHQAIARRFGPYKDIQDVIVKVNPSPPRETNLIELHEKDFIRDENPPRNAEMTIAGLFGEAREDSLVARWALGDIRQNTWISDALWALVLFDSANEHATAKPPRIQEAMQAAARAGLHVAQMASNRAWGMSSQYQKFLKGNQFEQRQSTKDAVTFMQPLIENQGMSVWGAAGEAYDAGVGTSQDANRKAWERHKKNQKE